MRTTRVLLPLVSLLAVVACGPPRDAESSVVADTGRIRDVDAIRERSESWDTAMRARDVERLVGLYAADAVIYEPELQPITGGAALRQHFEELVALDVRVMDTEIREIEVAASGDLAFETGYSHWEWVGPDGLLVDHGPYLVVWRKEDGEWRIAREIFNSDRPGVPTEHPASP